MNWPRSWRALLGTLLIAAAWPAAGADYRAGAVTVLDGTWEGKLRLGNVPPDSQEWEWSETPEQIRIVIKGRGAQVFTFNDGKWGLINKPFKMTSHRTNAVITGINSARDADGGWVETWTLTLTQVTWRQIKVTFVRQVNNEDLPRDDEEATWWHFAYGTLDLQDKVP